MGRYLSCTCEFVRVRACVCFLSNTLSYTHCHYHSNALAVELLVPTYHSTILLYRSSEVGVA